MKSHCLSSGTRSVVPTHLNTVVARRDASILHLHVGRRVGELALGVRPGALVALELAAHLQLQPAGVLAVQQVGHVHHGGHTSVTLYFGGGCVFCVWVLRVLGFKGDSG